MAAAVVLMVPVVVAQWTGRAAPSRRPSWRVKVARPRAVRMPQYTGAETQQFCARRLMGNFNRSEPCWSFLLEGRCGQVGLGLVCCRQGNSGPI